MSSPTLEYWLSGPIDNVPGLLQPVAHALLQARKEIEEALTDFPDELLWQQLSGVASVGFHLQHIPGVLDRLFTYAKGEQLNEQQLSYLRAEGQENKLITTTHLLQYLSQQVETSIIQLENTDENLLTQHRGVGRKQIPSTIAGLLFHAAEHTMRHTGQLLVTTKVISSVNLQ